MKKSFKIFFIILLFIVILNVFRLLWGNLYTSDQHPTAENGVLDLRNGQLAELQTIPLDGDWTFYPNALLKQNEFSQNQDKKRIGAFPISWNKVPEGTTYTVGTYHLQILLPSSEENVHYGVRMPVIQSASRLFVDGELVGEAGNPASSVSEYEALKVPYSVSFRSNKKTLDLIVHVAHGKYPIRSSEIGAIKFGFNDAINKETGLSVISQLVVLTVLGVVAIFTGILYFAGKKQKSLLYFFLLIVSAMFMILMDVDKFLLQIFPISYESSVKLQFLVYTSIATFMLLFFKHLFPEYASKRFYDWIISAYSVYIAFVLFAPVTSILYAKLLLGITLLTSTVYITIQFYRALKDRMEDVLNLLLSAAAITNNVIWAIIYSNSPIERFFYPVDLLITIFLFSAFWLKRFIRNVRQVEDLSEDLLQANKQKDAFLANTSHELRSPLHSIMNIAHSILHRKENRLRPQEKKEMDLLIKVGKRMSSMINDLLDLAKMRENKINLKLQPVHLQAVTSGVIDMLRYLTEEKPVEIQNLVSGNGKAVLADENRLIQILINLVHNAIKFTDNGTITISATYFDQEVIISVEDTGIGMNKDKINSIFKPYQQGTEEKDYSRGGLGLGLAISNQLVTLHGGKMVVNSILDKGSKFSFSLPLAEKEFSVVEGAIASNPSFEETAVSNELEIEGSSLKPEAPKLLVIDDETINLRVLKNILASEGYNITTVLSGPDALEKVKKERFHAVISDVMMPYMSGYELTKKIRKQYTLSELPILLLTARNSSEDLYTGFSSGANDYIVKPVDAVELKARVGMLVKLKTTMEEHMRMEAAWLQAQIKPHFLFNTLNAIMYLMEIDEVKMRHVLDHFISFIQTSFSFKNTDSLVTLEEELALVHSYIEIEKARFGERINVKWEVNQNSTVKLPPLSIQTLVENAINHGILKRAQGGIIKISVKTEEHNTLIAINDNGVGMLPDQQKLLFAKNPVKRSGVGIYNTDRRLKQLFGQGLKLDSALNKGTTISFYIPKKQ
ncbi:hybrid sensor histidine kinase/response regulator [Oceanobacillus kapialis]|uniref:histidine kinase n=1 Tax=Oceanobacillus kapialis TaxID=481353 RepID=A0ABW5PZK4_9BACI